MSECAGTTGAIMKSVRPQSPISTFRGATVDSRPWWAVPEGTPFVDRTARSLSTDEHVVSLRIGRQAKLGQFRIPQIPAIAAQTVALLRHSDADARQIARLIERDQQLAADVVSFANSALFAGVMNVSNIPQAISRVGFHRTRNLVLAASMRKMVYGAVELNRAEKLWRHACGCAAMAARVARNVGAVPDDAYLAGLFHDVGKTVVLSLLDTSALKREPAAHAADFIDYVLELYHEPVGVAITEQWHLPEHVVAAAGHHTDGPNATFTRAQAVVALANNACWRLNIGVKDDGRPIASRNLLDALGAGDDDLGTLLEGVREAAATERG
jgi:putative nucleotidyltransferase with HDIG domain